MTRGDDFCAAREGKSAEVGNDILQDRFLYFNAISFRIAQANYSPIVLDSKIMQLQELNNSWFGIFLILSRLRGTQSVESAMLFMRIALQCKIPTLGNVCAK
jgi:hypothetical protein